MNKKTLTTLFSESLFRIPDYQRGYAWELKQWNDFVQDIDALVDEQEQVKSHYTGTVVVYAGSKLQLRDYGGDRLRVVDVVDGQQRLTTSCLYLAEILRALVGEKQLDYESKRPVYLYAGATCKLTLNNDSGGVFHDLLRTGRPRTNPESPHEKRLVDASDWFRKHLQGQLTKRAAGGVHYLKELYHAVTQKLHFTFYEIEEECEIGMTFELMNSRGKGLSVLELLKNYLMHWVSRNGNDESERSNLTAHINKCWKDTYTNLGYCTGNEDQCLRLAWTLFCNHTPKSWGGYDGFKRDDYVPLRTFTSTRTKAATRDFIALFSDGLADISGHYASIINPTASNTSSRDELLWLTKIHHTGNVANFLPLIVAARKHQMERSVSETDYTALLKALECFAYRVFLYGRRKSNAGKSSFYRWGYEVFTKRRALHDVTTWVHSLTRLYETEESFTKENAKAGNWYGTRNRLKYTLFEYELHLLATEGQGKQPHLPWEQLKDSTIEHILPQTPAENSHWKTAWTPTEFQECVHDIANLVLTQDNSSYRNFEFTRKKGQPGQSPSYSNSDIRQERKISSFPDWTPTEFSQRRSELVTWVNARWKTEGSQTAAVMEVDDEADDDGIEALVEGAMP